MGRPLPQVQKARGILYMFERIKIAWQIIRNRKKFIMFMLDGNKVVLSSNMDPVDLYRFSSSYMLNMEHYEA